MTTTTAKHFARFEREVRRALRDLGVNDWQVYVEHQVLERGAAANCTMRLSTRTATIRLAKQAPGPVTDADLVDSARHEALHVALGEMQTMAESRHVTRDEVESANEATVQRFLRCVRWSGK